MTDKNYTDMKKRMLSSPVGVLKIKLQHLQNSSKISFYKVIVSISATFRLIRPWRQTLPSQSRPLGARSAPTVGRRPRLSGRLVCANEPAIGARAR